mgnify:FL=1
MNKNKQIKIIQSKFKDTYDFIFKNRIIAQIEKTDKKYKGINEYHMRFLGSYGFENCDIWTGYTDTKNIMIKTLLKEIENTKFNLNEYPNIKEYYNNITKI